MPPSAAAGPRCHMARVARCGWRKDRMLSGKEEKKLRSEQRNQIKSGFPVAGPQYFSQKYLLKRLLNGYNTRHICLMHSNRKWISMSPRLWLFKSF